MPAARRSAVGRRLPGGGSEIRTLGPSLARGRSKTSMSGPVGVGGFEEGEFEGDGPLEKVAAQILLRGADAVQLRAQEIDQAAKPRIVVQHNPPTLPTI